MKFLFLFVFEVTVDSFVFCDKFGHQKEVAQDFNHIKCTSELSPWFDSVFTDTADFPSPVLHAATIHYEGVHCIRCLTVTMFI